MQTHALSFAVLAALASVGHATTIYETDFTDVSYTTGALNGQNSWATNAGSPNVVAGTGVTTTGFEDNVNSTSTAASVVAAGETYTSSVTFTYNDASGGAGNGPHFGAYVSNGTDPSANSIVGFVVRRSGASYRLTMTTNWGGEYGDFGFNQSGTFTPSDIGITHGSDTTTDVLTMSIALTAGADTSSWTAVGTLFNETTDTEVQTWDGGSTGFTFAAAAGTNVYGGFGGGQGDGNQTISDRTASAFTFESTVPEPSTALLAGLGMLGLVRRRR